MALNGMPLFLVPEAGLDISSLPPQIPARVTSDGDSWSLGDLAGRRLFSFDLPDRVFAQHAANHAVLVFPQDRDLWSMPGPGRATMIRSDQNGRFTVRNIRPGRYYGVAVAELDTTAWTDPEYLQSVSARATPFSIGEGEKKTLDLKVTFPQ